MFIVWLVQIQGFSWKEQEFLLSEPHFQITKKGPIGSLTFDPLYTLCGHEDGASVSKMFEFTFEGKSWSTLEHLELQKCYCIFKKINWDGREIKRGQAKENKIYEEEENIKRVV